MSTEIHYNPAVWMWIGQHWALFAISITCLSLAVFVAVLLAKYVRICLNIFIDTHPPLSRGPVDFQPVHGEEVSFRSFDGTSLRGMMLRTRNRAVYKGTVMFCHEFSSDMYSCARYARPLIEAGFDVFTFDFRGHGESSCGANYRPLQWPSDKELEDVLGACAYVESSLAAEGRRAEIGLFGISRGAGAGLLAAANNPCIKAIICDSAFGTQATLIALMKRWAHIFARFKLVYENHTESFWRLLLWLLMRFAQPKLCCKFPSVRKALKQMQPRPILFVHGQKDSYIREQQTRELYAEAPSPKYLWIVEDAKHNQSVIIQPKQYATRTIAFFNRYLAEDHMAESEITSSADVEVA